MRPRRTVTATAAATAAGALALVLSLPASAGATEGDFFYVVDGDPQPLALPDPGNGRCINLPEVADTSVAPGHSPQNLTDSPATVYAGPDCTGAQYTLSPNSGPASEQLKVRSVLFLV